MESTHEHFRRLQTWFHRLLDEPTEVREVQLREIDLSDPPLASALRRLLDRADAEHTNMPAPATVMLSDAGPAPATEHAPGELPAGTVIDARFRIASVLGVGGMGEVYLAERLDETGQHVAIKLLRHDVGGGAHARFVRERRILARLNHPNIAHLLDGGLSSDGRAWFALEHVAGERITEFADSRELSLRERVALFVPVCDAVQYAHRNLILHRDLKPSNILVTADGTPKLLDFGIAKVLDDTSVTLDHAQTQTLALTPAYAAPEQLRGEPATTVSDTYQLGLILFELLSGLQAWKARRGGGDSAEASTLVPRADQALTRVGEDVATRLAQQRGLSRERLLRSLRGDLGRIVSKATADDPRERYGSARELADDLAHWLADEPVSAARGSFGYRLGKFVRRNRVATGLGVAALLLLAAGIGGVLWQAQVAQRNAERAAQVQGFFVQVLSDADPDASRGERVTVREVLDRSASALPTSTAAPALRAEFAGVLTDLYAKLGLYRESLPLHRQRIAWMEDSGTPDADTIEARIAQARAMLESNALADAGAVLDDIDTHHGKNPHALSPTVRADVRLTRGLWHMRQGHFQDAVAPLRESIALAQTADDPLRVAHAQTELADTLTNLESFDEALATMQAALATRKRVLGDEHSDVARTLLLLVGLQFYVDQYEAGLVNVDAALAIQRKLYGEDHVWTLGARAQRSGLLRNLMRFDEARAEIDDVIPRLVAVVGDGPDRTLADAYLQQGALDLRQADPQAALAAFDRGLERTATTRNADRVLRGSLHSFAGAALAMLQRFDEARPRMAAASEEFEHSYGLDSTRGKLALVALEAATSTPDLPAIEKNLRTAFAQAQSTASSTDKIELNVIRVALANNLHMQGRLDEARMEYRQAMDTFNRSLTQAQRLTHAHSAIAINGLASIDFAAGRALDSDVREQLPAINAGIDAVGLIPAYIKASAHLNDAEIRAVAGDRAAAEASLALAAGWTEKHGGDFDEQVAQRARIAALLKGGKAR